METLHTERLTLVALAPDLAQLALEDRVKLERMLEARVPRSWPGADFARMLPRIAQGSELASPEAESTRLIIHAADRVLIGETGFHGPPDGSGTLEVGYSIVPDYRGRGFACEATRALIDRAFERPSVRRIIATCLDDNHASIRVLEKLEMRRLGSAGEMLHFELLKG